MECRSTDRPCIDLPPPVQLRPIFPNDPLGREVFSERRARKARERGVITHDIFLERGDIDYLSVDRLDLAPDIEMAEIGDRNAGARGKRFFGWAEVSVEHASEMGRRVEPTPLLDNPYHADIFLNLPSGPERQDVARQHALNLAKHAAYRPRA